MKITTKLKYLRNFKNLSQENEGIMLGFKESTARSRIAQYERGIRSPKKDVIDKICSIYKIPDINFSESDDYDSLIKELMWREIAGQFDVAMLNTENIEDEYFKKCISEWKDKKVLVTDKKISIYKYREWLIKWPNV